MMEDELVYDEDRFWSEWSDEIIGEVFDAYIDDDTIYEDTKTTSHLTKRKDGTYIIEW